MPGRIVRVLTPLLIGLLIGVVGAFLQAQQTRVAGHLVPTGLLLAAAALIPVARACAWWAGSRARAVAFSAGWLVASLALGTTTPGGDLVLTSGSRQTAYLIGGTILLAAACGYPLLVRPERVRQPAEAPSHAG